CQLHRLKMRNVTLEIRTALRMAKNIIFFNKLAIMILLKKRVGKLVIEKITEYCSRHILREIIRSI
ncbi:MAG: hypothetical protein WCF01_06175, partial [Nitrososphaeraceae archaeon]